MQKSYPFYQYDVFTRVPFGGNQLAVFPDAQGLTTQQMQDLAREMNFSETTFVLPPEIPGAQKKVRIFTPSLEMPMAGHPTVGTSAALIQQGLLQPVDGSITLELGIGAVKVDIEPQPGDSPLIWMNHRLPVFSEACTDRAAVAQALGVKLEDIRADLPLEIVSTGVPFLIVPLASLEAIGKARSEAAALANLFIDHESCNVALFTAQTVDPNVSFHIRMYSPHLAGVAEDPATGSLAAPFGAYVAKHQLIPNEPKVTFLIEQGVEMKRPSQILVEVQRRNQEFTSLRIGGYSVLVGEGKIFWKE